MLPSRCLMFAGRALCAPIPSLLLSLCNSFSLVYASLGPVRAGGGGLNKNKPPQTLKTSFPIIGPTKQIGGHCRKVARQRNAVTKGVRSLPTHADCKHTCDSSLLPFTPINGRGRKPFQYCDWALQCDVADPRRRSASAVSWASRNRTARRRLFYPNRRDGRYVTKSRIAHLLESRFFFLFPLARA